MISKIRVAIVLLLFGATGYFVQVSTVVHPVQIKQSLSNFPNVIGEYRLSDSFQSSAEIIEMLGVDDYIQYNYINRAGERINLYVGYYESVGVDGGYHSPRNCIPGGGWGIDTITPSSLNQGIEGRQKSVVSEMLIRRGNEMQIVLYWYQNRGRVIASEYWEKVYQVVDALLMQRRDGTFVRIMTEVPESESPDETRKEIKLFAEQVMTTLQDYLPGTSV